MSAGGLAGCLVCSSSNCTGQHKPRSGEPMRWVADATMPSGGYYVARDSSAHFHKGQRRLLSLERGCTHSIVNAGRCAWCLEQLEAVTHGA